jgi:hypothetical protein
VIALTKAQVIDTLLLEFFRELDTLLAQGIITPELTAVNGLQRWMILPKAMTLLKALQADSKTEHPKRPPQKLVALRSTLHDLLEQIDRYLKGIANMLGRPISDTLPEDSRAMVDPTEIRGV